MSDPPESIPRRRIIMAANSSWNIVNFRVGLIRALRKEGYDLVGVAPVDEAVEHRMEELGLELRAIKLDRSGLNPVADFRLFLAYRRLLKRVSPTAFLGFTIKPNIYGGLAARMCGVPALVSISGLGTVFIKRTPLTLLVIALYRISLRRAKAAFFENPEDLDLFLRKRIVRPDQARLLPGCGIDLDHFTPAAYPPGAPRFVLIGRLLGDKGVREYVEAARSIKRRHPEAAFQLLGPIDPGNRTSIQQAELDAWIAEGVIEYLGAAEDVRPFIEAASAIVLPSYREGLPRSLLEGAAMARPLIAADVPGCREIVGHRINGLLCEARSSDSLARAFETFIAMSPAERREMGLAGRRLAEQRFSEKHVIDAYLDVLKSL